MNVLHSERTIIAEWCALVDDAMLECGHSIDEVIKHYLVITLDHYSTDCQLSSVVVAIDFLQGLETVGRLSYVQLRQVGDRCLLLAGLFPDRAYKKNVTERYYVNIGRQAYDVLAHVPVKTIYDVKLYQKLSDEFLYLTMLLKAMRNLKSKTFH